MVLITFLLTASTVIYCIYTNKQYNNMNRVWIYAAYIWGFTVEGLILGFDVNLYLMTIIGSLVIGLIASKVDL